MKRIRDLKTEKQRFNQAWLWWQTVRWYDRDQTTNDWTSTRTRRKRLQSRNLTRVNSVLHNFMWAQKSHKHIHTGEKPDKCGECRGRGGGCWSDFCFQKPWVQAYGEKYPQSGWRDKSFHQLGKHMVHERTHTGGNPLSCSFCEKTFNTSSVVKKTQTTKTWAQRYLMQLRKQQKTWEYGKVRRQDKHVICVSHTLYLYLGEIFHLHVIRFYVLLYTCNVNWTEPR